MATAIRRAALTIEPAAQCRPGCGLRGRVPAAHNGGLSERSRGFTWKVQCAASELEVCCGGRCGAGHLGTSHAVE